jgi:hypothetical protein
MMRTMRAALAVMTLLVGMAWLGSCLRCSDLSTCPLSPAHWNAEGLDDESFQQISFAFDGSGEMSYAFNYIVHTDVRFQYRAERGWVDIRYTRGTSENQRRVRFTTTARRDRCELRFEDTPFPGDVESLEVTTYSRVR